MVFSTFFKEAFYNAGFVKYFLLKVRGTLLVELGVEQVGLFQRSHALTK